MKTQTNVKYVKNPSSPDGPYFIVQNESVFISHENGIDTDVVSIHEFDEWVVNTNEFKDCYTWTKYEICPHCGQETEIEIELYRDGKRVDPLTHKIYICKEDT